MLTLVPDVLPRRSRLTFPPREQAMRGAAGHACMHAIVVLAPRSVARCWTPFPLATCKRPTFVITCLNLSSGFPVQARRSSQAGYLRESVLPRSIFTHAVIRERLRSGVSLLPKAQRRHIKAFPGGQLHGNGAFKFLVPYMNDLLQSPNPQTEKEDLSP